ncbi:MAG: glycosyltransferase family 4 protein [Usitatibacter sp.]
MSILFGHPSGGPFSHNAALAHYESGRLEAFCVPWLPSAETLRMLSLIGPLRPMAARLSRRHFPALANAPTVQGRAGEMVRLLKRAVGGEDERLSYEANDWLMRTMRRECRRPRVTAVHSYEDCSEWQFEEARRLGKACLYDMPIGYYPAWEQTQMRLAREYADWLPAGGLSSARIVRPAQKRREMELADLVLVPCRFVEETIRAYHPEKRIALAPYGVDLEFWNAPRKESRDAPLRFICAGQISLRKGVPLLLEAWKKAALTDCHLELVGGWRLSERVRESLPSNVSFLPPCSPEALRERYRQADVFVFPSFFEGFGLVLLEAMACGLPAIASTATAGPDVLDSSCGQVVATGDAEALIAALRWFDARRGQLPEMSGSARKRAEQFTWENYRRCVSEAVASFV